MSYRIELTPSATKDLKKLDRPEQRRLQAAIELLAETPRPPAAKKLVNSGGAWRVRTGSYRIIYEIHDDLVLVLVLRLGHRREIYR